MLDDAVLYNISSVVSKGDMEMLKHVLQTNQILLTDLKSMIDAHGNNALHWCGTICGESLTLYLIQLGVDINRVNNQKQLPLHIHCRNNCLYGVSCLLSNGSLINSYCSMELELESISNPNLLIDKRVLKAKAVNSIDQLITRGGTTVEAYLHVLDIAELFQYVELQKILFRFNAKKS